MLEEWIRIQHVKGNRDGGEMGSTLLKLYGDEPFPYPLTQAAPEGTPQDILGHAISEYKKGHLTPELVDATWQTIWKTWGERINHTFQVPSCDRTPEELGGLAGKNRAVLLVPDEIYTKEGLVLIGKMFPKIQGWTKSENVKVKDNNGGSIDIEMDIDSPNRNTSEDKARNIFIRERRRVQRFATYIVGSQFSQLLTGRYLDEGSTWSRCFDSVSGGFAVAKFESDGRLKVARLSVHPSLGYRSEGVKEA
ncbi:MAG: hypothetical protein HYT07_00730 [Candidatus Levybacteria bacterium]|nr:hypothetical protein [Candidatus Levybacteria bacterium]